jgi:hypothetical protein
MATKKKASKKKTSAGRKSLPTKTAQLRKTSKKSAKKAVASKKSAPKKTASKKTLAKKAPITRKALETTSRQPRGKKTSSANIPKGRNASRPRNRPPFSNDYYETRSAGQSGDLQGLSDVENADSESVDELLEEGNAFEAGVVSGVEEADEHEGQEVHTHEVPEDDVPEEYLDKD